MPMCPYCHTVVSEDTHFCPECGRPLPAGEVAVGEGVKGRSRKKLAGIIAACTVAIIVIAVIATRPPSALEPEPTIPAHYATYTDGLGRFSISYPPEWELDLEYLEDISVEGAQFLFMAGLPTMEGYYAASVNVVVGPCPGIICTHDAMVSAEIAGMKATEPGCLELSRVKTTVDGRTATILVSQDPISYEPTCAYAQMFLLVGRTEWCVTCITLTGDYSNWEDDFNAIVRSLRILK